MGKIKRIHVNQHNIRHNSKTGDMADVVSVKCGGKNYTGHGAEFMVGRLVYSPDKPLSCGAKVWIETTETVKILDVHGEVKEVLFA
jgi:predicted RNA-binding protein